MNNNPHDPLHAIQTEGTRALFMEYSRVAEGHTFDQVVVASINMLVNAMRQACPTNIAAEAAWDELSAKGKGVLMDHYDASGRRRSIFAHTQTIDVPLHVEKQKF